MVHDRHTFILRVWRGNERNEEWKASLVNIPDGEAVHFRSLAELYSSLCTRLAASEQPARGMGAHWARENRSKTA